MQSQILEEKSLEDYLKHTGWGLYYKFLLGVACACNFTIGTTFATITYTVALSSCDDIFIPEINAIRIFTSYLIGAGIGGFLGSSLSDRYGRKRYLGYSLICMFFASFAAAFAHNVFVVIISTLILGVGLETCEVQARLLVIESMPKKNRGLWITFCHIFWSLGYVLTIFLVILFETPTILNAEKNTSLGLTTWRIMFAVNGGASLLIACICALIEESPRYYLATGKIYLAYLLLKQLFAINNSSFAEYFKAEESDLRNIIKPYDLQYIEPESYWLIFKTNYWRLWKSLQLIFSKRFGRITWILMLLKIFPIAIGVFQYNIILAKHLTFRKSTSLTHSTTHKYQGLDFIYPMLRPLSYMSQSELSKANSTLCKTNENNRIFYKYLLILMFAILPGQCLSMFIVDRLGRKFVLFGCLVLLGCAILILGFVDHLGIQILATCVIMESIASLVPTLALVNAELYPTAIRSTSNAVTSAPGYLLATVFLNAIIIDRQNYTIISGILCFCLSVFICFLPESKGKPMVE